MSGESREIGMPKLCEKCGNYDPTYELTADSCCPRCGVIYANLPQPQTALTAVPAGPAGPAPIPTGAPAAVDTVAPDWGPVKPAEFWTSVAAVGVLFALIFFDDDGFLLLLDGANLAFHEAGHIFFGLLGMTLGLYGGTLGQLVFPIVAGVKFWQQRQAVAFALSGVWLFQNFLNIARYMADARAKALPLVGGGEHDWSHIFTRWGLLDRDTTIASITQTAGWLGMVACMLWLWRRFSAQR
jgi:hypothetical protein